MYTVYKKKKFLKNYVAISLNSYIFRFIYLFGSKVYRNNFKETNVKSFIGPLKQVFKNSFLNRSTCTMIKTSKQSDKKISGGKKE